jgi:prevent-host-death family protein
MATRISATELANSLSDVLNRVKYRDERFLVERNGEPVAEIGPVHLPESVTIEELLARLADVPFPDPDFAADLARIRTEQGLPRNPWPS